LTRQYVTISKLRAALTSRFRRLPACNGRGRWGQVGALKIAQQQRHQQQKANHQDHAKRKQAIANQSPQARIRLNLQIPHRIQRIL
jgi:hypothetical protein